MWKNFPPFFVDLAFEMDPRRVSRARWIDQLDPSSVVAIRLTTKPCPKCRTPTERDGGCMHMACMANHWFG